MHFYIPFAFFASTAFLTLLCWENMSVAKIRSTVLGN